MSRPNGASHRLTFTGLEGAATQIRLCDNQYTVERHAEFGSQELTAPRPEPTRDVRGLLAVLESVLTLPAPDNVDFALALDWYKSPVGGVSGDRWENTTIGALVHNAKYPSGDRDPSTFEDGAALLADQLHAVVRSHPLLRGVDAVTTPPGHDPRLRNHGFGVRLARAVTERMTARRISCRGPDRFRTSAKDLEPGQLGRIIAGTFTCAADVRGMSVLIVDDVYRSGVTMSETARSLRQAGAWLVAGLCPVRTVRC